MCRRDEYGIMKCGPEQCSKLPWEDLSGSGIVKVKKGEKVKTSLKVKKKLKGVKAKWLNVKMKQILYCARRDEYGIMKCGPEQCSKLPWEHLSRCRGNRGERIIPLKRNIIDDVARDIVSSKECSQ